jgi:hypothetical protein
VSEVDLSSLRLHRAQPVNTTFRDVNADGKPDLVAEFRGSDVRLAKEATRARIAGWLKNSQAFFGEDDVKVLPEGLVNSVDCR